MIAHLPFTIVHSPAVTLKVMKDYKPGKTQLCITATSSSTSQHSGMVSKSRTLKVMRSALAGLPVLTPLWMEACLKDETIVPPTKDMCIRTLPTKQTSKEDGAADQIVAEHL